MKFWAIAFLYQDDVWFDFEKKDDVLDLEPVCLLPTREMAEQYIAEELSDRYMPVEITIETVSPHGAWSYTRGNIPNWD